MSADLAVMGSSLMSLRGFLCATGGLLWLITAGAGYAWLNGYATTPGGRLESPDSWPATSNVARPGDERSAVVMIAHPRCPCTLASIDELAAALRGVPAQVVEVTLVISGFASIAGAETELLKTLGARHGWRVQLDTERRDALAFGALTSGHVLMYGPGGSLVYSGGVTPARDHRGPNTGAAAVRAIALGERPPAASAPVFGCPLFETEGSTRPITSPGRGASACCIESVSTVDTVEGMKGKD